MERCTVRGTLTKASDGLLGEGTLPEDGVCGPPILKGEKRRPQREANRKRTKSEICHFWQSKNSQEVKEKHLKRKLPEERG